MADGVGKSTVAGTIVLAVGIKKEKVVREQEVEK